MKSSGPLAQWLIKRAHLRDPDFVIGGPDAPYLRRWYLIPRNPIFNLYLHQLLRSDDDRALHDHPWLNVTRVLAGGYIEVLPQTQCQPRHLDFAPFGLCRVSRACGAWVVRWARSRHRLEVPAHTSGETWTLFITGPAFRRWGFHCPKGWRHWPEFVSDADRGAVGRGCD